MRQHSVNTLVVEPLFSRDEQLGFIMLDGSGCEGQVYRVLQEQISSALKSVLLLQENVRLYHAAALRAERSDAAQQAAQEKQRLAEEADRLKSRFLSMVSHELRTPLILLEGLSEMMLREGLGSRPPCPLRTARIWRASVQPPSNWADWCGMCWTWPAARSASCDWRSSRSTSQPCCNPRSWSASRWLAARAWTGRWRSRPTLPEVCGDGARLQEVTLNLISNAVKFTALGEVRLRIDADKGDVVVSISDTGLGVPLEEQQAIFDEFRQSERTAARGFGGLGVGLAICREIVRLHGGEIGVRSSGLVDGGSSFFYRLPALEPAAPRAAAPPAVSGAEPPSQSIEARPVGLPPCTSRSQAVVLLTEQAAGGELLHAHLREQGFDVEVLPVEDQGDWLAQLLAAAAGRRGAGPAAHLGTRLAAV